jgi:esterase/lipase superfamily enzyme
MNILFNQWHFRLLWPLSILLAVCVSGCASSSDGLMTSVTAPPGLKASQVELLVVTNRARSPNPRFLYSGDRSDALSINEVVVSIPDGSRRHIGQIQWPQNAVRPDLTKNFGVSRLTELDESEALDWFGQRSPASRGHLLIFGFVPAKVRIATQDFGEATVS